MLVGRAGYPVWNIHMFPDSMKTFFQCPPDSARATPRFCTRSTRRRPVRCSRGNSTRLCCPPQCVCNDQSGYNHVFVVDWCWAWRISCCRPMANWTPREWLPYLCGLAHPDVFEMWCTGQIQCTKPARCNRISNTCRLYTDAVSSIAFCQRLLYNFCQRHPLASRRLRRQWIVFQLIKRTIIMLAGPEIPPGRNQSLPTHWWPVKEWQPSRAHLVIRFRMFIILETGLSYVCVQ